MGFLFARQAWFDRRYDAIKVRDPQFTHPTGPPGPPTTSSSSTTSSTISTTDSSTSATSSLDAATSTTSDVAVTSRPSTSPSSIASPSSSSSPPLPLIAATASSTTAPVSSSTVSAALQTANDSYNNGPPTSIVAAAVAVPIVVLIVVFTAFMLFRRRRRSANGFDPAMQERVRDNAPFITPVMMSNTNTAYYTGLETASELYGERSPTASYTDTSSYIDPPPAYKAQTHIPTAGSSGEGIPGVPLVRLPTGMPNNPPSLDSWTTPRDGAFQDSSSAFTRSVVTASRSASAAGTERSINSDLYSDNASVHSARAARLSVAGAAVTQEYNPFDDPASPVSSAEGETRSLASGVPSRSISPVSHESR